jgi:hypothetical protein
MRKPTPNTKTPQNAALRSSVPESHCWHLLEHAGRFIRGTAASGQNADSMPHYTLRPSHTSVLSAEERRDRIWLDSSQRSACTRAHTSDKPPLPAHARWPLIYPAS